MLITKKQLRTIIKEELSAVLIEAKKRKGKPNCSPGNPYRNEDGEFSDKGKASVFSLQFVEDGPDCKAGVVKMPGHKATRHPCGRKSKHSNRKADYRCKDGQPVDELKEDNEVQDLLIASHQRIKELEQKIALMKRTELARCLNRVDVTQRAAAGELQKPKN